MTAEFGYDPMLRNGPESEILTFKNNRALPQVHEVLPQPHLIGRLEGLCEIVYAFELREESFFMGFLCMTCDGSESLKLENIVHFVRQVAQGK